MALTGNGTTDYIKTTSAVAAIARPSFHFFYRNAAAPGVASIQKPFSLDDGASAYYFVFAWDHTSGTANQAITLRDSGATYTDCQFTTVLTNNTWYGIGGTYDGTNIIAYLDGVADTTTAASALTTGSNPKISLLSGLAGTGEYDDGTIAEVGVWNVSLSATDFAVLGKGVSPLLVRPDALVFYAPLVRPIQDLRGNALTTSGGTVADHPRMYYSAAVQTWPGTATVTMTNSQSIAHTLTLTQGANEGATSHTVSFSQSVQVQNVYQTLEQGVTFTSRISANSGSLASGRRKQRPNN